MRTPKPPRTPTCEPLAVHPAANGRQPVPMTFAEIERLVGGPVPPASVPPAPVTPAPKPGAAAAGDHPLWGALAGTVRVLPGSDLTEPARPDRERDALAGFDPRMGQA